MLRYRVFPTLAVICVISSMLACNLPGGAAAPGAASSSSEPAPQTSAGHACSNPLYPVIIGATWTYTLSGITTDTYTHSITAVTDTGFTDKDVFTSGVTRTGEWKCEDGTLIALSPESGPSGAVQTSQMTATFHTTEMNGVTLPAAVKTGDSWTQNFTLEGTQSIGGQQADAKLKTAYACTAGGTESVTVPAGTFDALRVDCKIDATITVTMNGVEVPTSLSSTAAIWYAPGVGQVKVENAISNVGNSTIELTAYTIP